MYNTAQYRALREYFRGQEEGQRPSEEIIAALCPGGSGRSTVYRLLARMTEEGELRRFHQGKRVYYQYMPRHEDCGGHFHLKCTRCGRLIHLDCGRVGEFTAHIAERHGFALDMRETVLYGLCQGCK